MGIDAVAVLRVRSRKALRACLEAARVSPSSVVPLDDEAVLFSTHVRFGRTAGDHTSLRLLLARVFGEGLARIHDDPQGVLFYPDVCEPQARTYDGVVAEVQGAGTWVSADPLTEEQLKQHQADFVAEVKRLLADPSGLEVKPAQSFGLGTLRLSTKDVDVAAKSMGVGSFEALVSQVESRLGELGLVNDEGIHACLLLNRREPLPSPLPDANQVHALDDGAQIVVTTRFAGDHETVALRLGGELASWLHEYIDERGVPLFGDKALGEVLASASYDEALSTLGGRAHWIKPKSLEDLVRERELAAKAFLDEE